MLGTIVLSLVLAYRSGFELTFEFFVLFSFFVIFSVASIVTVMFFITYALDKILVQKKLNPDDVLIPVVTTITDVFMLGLIALAAKFLF